MTNRHNLNFGLIACSNVAQQRFIPAIKKISNADLTFVGASNNINKAKMFSIKNDIKKYGTYRDVLTDLNIDAVYISSPVTLHKKLTVNSLQQNKHVLCEKPAAMSKSDALEIISECNKNDLAFLEGFMFQFHTQHITVRDIIKAGEIGRVLSIKAQFTYPHPAQHNIRLDPTLGGGVFFDSIGYPTLAVLMIEDSDPVSIQATQQVDKTLLIDTEVSATIKFESGVTAEILAGFSDNYISEYVIKGSEGYIRVCRAYSVTPDHDPEIIVNGKIRKLPTDDQFKSMITHFIDSIKCKKKRHINNTKFIKLHTVLDNMLKSINNNKNS
jgi:predicted dehydrogenase